MVRPSNKGIRAASRKIFLLASVLLGFALLFPSELFSQSDEWRRLNQQSASLYQQGDYKRAAELATQALELADRELGPEHPAVAISGHPYGEAAFR